MSSWSASAMASSDFFGALTKTRKRKPWVCKAWNNSTCI